MTNQTLAQGDLIAAIASGTGPGAVSLIRLSGLGAYDTLRRVFVSASDPMSKPRTMIFGKLIKPQSKEVIDQVLAVFFPGPQTFTGEDTAEIFGHGGATVPRLVLEAVMEAGARLANPGEFTQRAFLNDRLSLDQAEAVADLVAAQSEAEATLATRHLEGALSAKIKPAIEKLIGLQAELVAILDFEEDWNEEKRLDLISMTANLSGEIKKLVEIRKNGRIFRDGLRVVLTGLPNAGKSSLFNAILGRDRALVSPRPGTTRDYLEASVSWNGLRVELVDTAGLGQRTGDELEDLGQQLALKELEAADIIVWLRSVTEPGPDEPPLARETGKILEVWSKSDLKTGQPISADSPSGLCVSALTGEGLDELKSLILKKTGLATGLVPEIVPNLRQQKALEDSLEQINRALSALTERETPDIVAFELGQSLESLNYVTGQAFTEEILNEVFSNFCVGK
ncbi:MAG: tRNA uridine-5-carboxymethylaminomethyl(34) synthesis GTPase MnmE [Deltaproteobacteria bacterium]|jgi:tRNA modification GTPase|nr:tRNA uridine-5-carboxymethylaminomethyl(34) synthesis GTPase MnmE [Deltaproteobacteria bacterium]